MHHGDREGPLPAGQGGHTLLDAAKHGQKAPVAGTVDDGRAQHHQLVAGGAPKNLFHQILGPAVGGNGRADGLVIAAGHAVGRAAGRQTGNQHYARQGAAPGTNAHDGCGQMLGGNGIGAQVVLPVQAEEQGRHVDEDVLPADGLGHAVTGGKIGPGHGNPLGQVLRAR